MRRRRAGHGRLPAFGDAGAYGFTGRPRCLWSRRLADRPGAGGSSGRRSRRWRNWTGRLERCPRSRSGRRSCGRRTHRLRRRSRRQAGRRCYRRPDRSARLRWPSGSRSDGRGCRRRDWSRRWRARLRCGGQSRLALSTLSRSIRVVCTTARTFHEKSSWGTGRASRMALRVYSRGLLRHRSTVSPQDTDTLAAISVLAGWLRLQASTCLVSWRALSRALTVRARGFYHTHRPRASGAAMGSHDGR